MSILKQKLKVLFPGFFDLYKHFRRRKSILIIAIRKRIPSRYYPYIVAHIYKKRIGRHLDWNNLNTYTEKMQWAKLYDNSLLKTICTDKIKVRSIVEERIGNKYLIPIYGSWDSYQDIDFDSLPNQFVLKTNHGSGTNIIIHDKKSINIKQIERAINDWLKTDYGYKSFELHYSDIDRKVFAEQFIESTDNELDDYKFLCFDGVPYYCWVDQGRYSNHTRNVYDLDWNLQPWNQETYPLSKKVINKPENFSEMVEIASKLSQGFSHVRVDLYNVSGKIYFGELTFTNGGGFDRIIPEEYDYHLGELWHLK